MATYEEAFTWVKRHEDSMKNKKYGRNKTSISLEKTEEEKRRNEISSYENEHFKSILDKTTDPDEKAALQDALNNIKALNDKRIQCLQTAETVSLLEDNCCGLSNEFDIRAVSLAHPSSVQKQEEKSGINLPGFIGTSAQDCINGLSDNWHWIIQIVKCMKLHLKNGASYHEFFHEIEESEPWMTDDFTRMSKFFTTKNITGDEREIKQLVSELDTMCTTFRQWEAKTTRLWETATKLISVPLRTETITQSHPARSLLNYETNEFSVHKNEDIMILDNSQPKVWKIKNGKGQEAQVPAPMVLILGSDKRAVEAAVKLRLQLMAAWTNALKETGKRLICFMLIVFKPHYTTEEIVALKSMNAADKEHLLQQLTDIEDGFKKHWEDHEGFVILQERILVLRMILEDTDQAVTASNDEMSPQLAAKISDLHQAVSIYQNAFIEWEKYKAVLEASRSPELMLIVDTWEQLQFVTKEYVSKFWKTKLPLDESDLALNSLRTFTVNGIQFDDVIGSGNTRDTSGTGGMVERGLEEITRSDITISGEDEEDAGITKIHSKPLEYESRIVDENSKDGIRQHGIASGGIGGLDEENLEQMEGRAEGECSDDEYDGTGDFGVAKERKTVETEQLSSAQMEEKQTFVIKSVINPIDQTEISLQQAIMLGIIRPTEGVYVNTITGETEPIAIAMGKGQIKVSFTTTKRTQEKTSSIGIITVKTIREGLRPYIIHSVKDTQTGEDITQGEATKRGMLNEGQGIYNDKKTGKKWMIAEAAEKGFINIEYCGEQPKPEVVSKTYAVRAVVDHKQKKTVTFHEAVKRGIIDKESGAYCDTLTGEKMYVGDAIIRGFLKARVVEDVAGLDIDPENNILIDKTQKTIREKILRPLMIVSAFKMAGKKT